MDIQQVIASLTDELGQVHTTIGDLVEAVSHAALEQEDSEQDAYVAAGEAVNDILALRSMN